MNVYSMVTKSVSEKKGYILNVSSNLLGICFIVLASLKVSGKSNATIIDDISAAAIVLFMASCIGSFLSMKVKGRPAVLFENLADGIFLSGLTLLFVTTLLFSFNIIS